MDVGGVMARVDSNGSIAADNLSRASPSALANPQDVNMVPFHFLEDQSRSSRLPHGSDIPSANLDVGFWRE